MIRRASDALARPLNPEDCCVQSMPDVSPTKWHLAHTTWFFETFVLKVHVPGYQTQYPEYEYLFNSYYNAVGQQFPRPNRGLLSRPTLDEVMKYRASVDEAVDDLLATDPGPSVLSVVELGTHHEQQHQELMLMDIKHVFWCNPLRPVYRELPLSPEVAQVPLRWLDFDGGLVAVGYDGDQFAFDNETPQHRQFFEPFQLANRLVTCGEYLEFIDEQGYQRPELWLAEGWAVVQQRQWEAPLYWQRTGECWQIVTLGGTRELNPNEPVCHVSFFEADAFARWRGCWLPREGAWESAVSTMPIQGNFVESERLQPMPVDPGVTNDGLAQMFGDVWEWTSSPYSAYPGYRARAGALGEYNGKFMSSQMVLRGGSCVTPVTHVRSSYRNFFSPEARWPFTGIRLAREIV